VSHFVLLSRSRGLAAPSLLCGRKFSRYISKFPSWP